MACAVMSAKSGAALRLPKRPLTAHTPRVTVRRARSARLRVEGFLDDGREAAKLPRLQPMPVAETVVMEGFGWQSWEGRRWWRTLRAQVPDLAAAGITHLWLPPPSSSVSPQGYLPSQLYNLDSSYGTHQELKDLCADLRKAGIRPVADIVINHRCADEQDETGTWNIYRDTVPHPGKSIAWGRWAIAGSDNSFRGQGQPDTGDDYGPAPDLDHANPEVRDGLVDWLNWLRDELGMEGWRFDFVKGYHPRFTQEYIQRTVGADAFSVGELFLDLKWSNSFLEYNQEEARARFRDWLREAKHCCAFDFITKGQLQEAIKNHEYDRLRDAQGRAPGLMGLWPEQACTFVDNHDTGSTQQHWPFPRGFLAMGYAYILTHPGIPCIMHEHFMDGGLRKTITDLVALRRKAGVRADSRLEILAAEHDMYVARCNGNVTVKLGPRFDMPQNLVPRKEDGWALRASGPDFAVWAKDV